MMLEVTPIPAFSDNYIWLLHADGHAVAVDPGDAAPVLDFLQRHRLALDAILITHHHSDHVGGVATLLGHASTQVYAPAAGRYAFAHQPVKEGDSVELPALGLTLAVMETPGHTLDHVAYHGAHRLFCGDTLFSCGCGRLFEGSCGQLHHSLLRLARLAPHTQVYCTHEYTQHNIAFALTVEPENAALHAYADDAARRRAAGQPTLPSTLAQERAVNPFLRCGEPAVKRAAERICGAPLADESSVFCALRTARNHF